MNKRIPIVDDETNVRLNFRMTPETEGYEIFEACSGEEAVQLLAEHSFALAILDMRMPGMDGLELLAKMRESGIRLPVMIVTAYSDVPHAVKAMKLGAIDFLVLNWKLFKTSKKFCLLTSDGDNYSFDL